MSTNPPSEPSLSEDLVLPTEPQSVWAYWRERALYWSPVFALMVLFAQIAFLGLRPALAEERRMDIAERGMQERLEVAERNFSELEAQLAMRKDPIFHERLRRLRIHPPTAQ